MPRLPRRRPLRVAAFVGLVGLLVIGTTGLLGVLFPTRALASSSTLAILDGTVQVSTDGTTFSDGKDGDLVQAGYTVRTAVDSHAVLTFFDGSIVEIEPESELVIETLQASSAGDIVMQMQQTVGRSWHVVSHSLSAGSKYEVRTPASTASVRGTAFIVNVSKQGVSNFQTTEGTVTASSGGKDVEVKPGFETTVPLGNLPPPEPVKQPDPPATVQVTVDATPNAAVVDANKRTVGVVNGIPVRYMPGSTMEVKDGKLIMTIPNPTLGKLDTHVQPKDSKDTSVDVNVQVQIGGQTVGNVTEKRNIDQNGVAQGGVLITNVGTLVLPTSDTKNNEVPKIGKIPTSTGFTNPFGGGQAPSAAPIISLPPDFNSRFNFDPRGATAPSSFAPPTFPTTTTTAADFGGAFQPYFPPTTGATTGTTGTATTATTASVNFGIITLDELARRLTTGVVTTGGTTGIATTGPVTTGATTTAPTTGAIPGGTPPTTSTAGRTSATTIFVTSGSIGGLLTSGGTTVLTTGAFTTGGTTFPFTTGATTLPTFTTGATTDRTTGVTTGVTTLPTLTTGATTLPTLTTGATTLPIPTTGATTLPTLTTGATTGTTDTTGTTATIRTTGTTVVFTTGATTLPTLTTAGTTGTTTTSTTGFVPTTTLPTLPGLTTGATTTTTGTTATTTTSTTTRTTLTTTLPTLTTGATTTGTTTATTTGGTTTTTAGTTTTATTTTGTTPTTTTGTTTIFTTGTTTIFTTGATTFPTLTTGTTATLTTGTTTTGTTTSTTTGGTTTSGTTTGTTTTGTTTGTTLITTTGTLITTTSGTTTTIGTTTSGTTTSGTTTTTTTFVPLTTGTTTSTTTFVPLTTGTFTTTGFTTR